MKKWFPFSVPQIYIKLQMLCFLDGYKQNLPCIVWIHKSTLLEFWRLSRLYDHGQAEHAKTMVTQPR